jgi:hypothetical protein
MCQLQNLFLVYKLRKQKNGTLISFPLVPLCFYFTFHKLIQALMLSSHGPREQLLAFKSNQTPPLRQLQKKHHIWIRIWKKNKGQTVSVMSPKLAFTFLYFSHELQFWRILKRSLKVTSLLFYFHYRWWKLKLGSLILFIHLHKRSRLLIVLELCSLHRNFVKNSASPNVEWFVFGFPSVSKDQGEETGRRWGILPPKWSCIHAFFKG